METTNSGYLIREVDKTNGAGGLTFHWMPFYTLVL